MNKQRVCSPDEARQLLDSLKTAYNGLTSRSKEEVREHIWEAYTDNVLREDGWIGVI